MTGCGKSIGAISIAVSLADRTSPGDRLLQLGDGADVADAELGRLLVLLALEQHQLAEPLLCPRPRVDDRRVAFQRAGENAEDRDLARERVGDGLEDEGRGAVARGLVELLGRRGNALDEQVEQAGGPEVLGRDAAPDREELAARHGRFERPRQLLTADLLPLEVALHDRLVRLDHGVHELLAILGRLVGDLVGKLDRWALPPAARRQVGAQVEQVDDTLQLVLVSDRELHRDAAVRELRANPLEGGEEVRALAVEHVDVEEARDAELLAPLPDTARLHLDAGDRVDDDERPFDHAQRGDGVGLEAGVPGRVDQVDLRPAPLEVAHRSRQRHLALVLVLVPVGDRRALLHRSQPVRGLRLEEQRLDQ